jgi:A/G-specific adenine glycosylase
VRRPKSSANISADPEADPLRDPRRFRHRLLSWFNGARRDLPWRRNRDPYRIWVSEVMLQQTTVAAVVPYFERFLAAFPDVVTLARADEQEVLRHWEGLGYYRRAKYLHTAARRIVDDHSGRLPNDPAVWRDLPGVGRYTAAAVLSQAFDRRLPVVEANSVRVLCRLFGRNGDPRSSEAQAWLWRTAEELLPRKRVGDYNQALMELGALICTPASPDCGACPVRKNCRAWADGTQDRIPAKSSPPDVIAVHEVAVVVHRRGRVLLVRRSSQAARWANMWEFPHGERLPAEDHCVAARRVLRQLTGLTAHVGPELLTVRHAVARCRITMVALEATWRRGEFSSHHHVEGRWLRPRELSTFPLPVAQRRLAEAVARSVRQRRLF